MSFATLASFSDVGTFSEFTAEDAGTNPKRDSRFMLQPRFSLRSPNSCRRGDPFLQAGSPRPLNRMSIRTDLAEGRRETGNATDPMQGRLGRVTDFLLCRALFFFRGGPSA
jgi:hypothetical protein